MVAGGKAQRRNDASGRCAMAGVQTGRRRPRENPLIAAEKASTAREAIFRGCPAKILRIRSLRHHLATGSPTAPASPGRPAAPHNLRDIEPCSAFVIFGDPQTADGVAGAAEEASTIQSVIAGIF